MASTEQILDKLTSLEIKLESYMSGQREMCRAAHEKLQSHEKAISGNGNNDNGLIGFRQRVRIALSIIIFFATTTVIIGGGAIIKCIMSLVDR